jgi:hypothetical protein
MQLKPLFYKALIIVLSTNFCNYIIKNTLKVGTTLKVSKTLRVVPTLRVLNIRKIPLFPCLQNHFLIPGPEFHGNNTIDHTYRTVQQDDEC